MSDAVMRIVSADDIQNVLTYRALIDALGEAFRSDIAVPMRHHHTIATSGADATPFAASFPFATTCINTAFHLPIPGNIRATSIVTYSQMT